MKTWTESVYDIVRRLPPARAREFSTADVYAYERRLQRAHPDNRNVRAKIRQQLQVLRDRGLLKQPKRGHWRVVAVRQDLSHPNP
ncbi:MAG TPA: hypothetical protein VMO20_09770 [Candidatus Acidoferrum sp.]|nr:hypothetical protein [Candidatus Acidoferrum sp.]